MNFEGKVVLVTGASRGIGKAVALAFAQGGAKVCGTATSEKGAEAISAYLGANGKGLVLDVSSQESIDACLKAVHDEFGDVDILVNNAGPRQFINYIGNAEMVITYSFHGTVFSVIMEAKNFYAYIAPGNVKGSRITDLLKIFQIEDHLLNPDLKQSWSELSDNKLDKTCLDKIYLREQKYSRDFLVNSLKGNER